MLLCYLLLLNLFTKCHLAMNSPLFSDIPSNERFAESARSIPGVVKNEFILSWAVFHSEVFTEDEVRAIFSLVDPRRPTTIDEALQEIERIARHTKNMGKQLNSIAELRQEYPILENPAFIEYLIDEQRAEFMDALERNFARRLISGALEHNQEDGSMTVLQLCAHIFLKMEDLHLPARDALLDWLDRRIAAGDSTTVAAGANNNNDDGTMVDRSNEDDRNIDKDSKNGFKKDLVCPICLESMPSTEPEGCVAEVNPCFHRFHAGCLQRWIRSGQELSTRCPCCRQDMLPNQNR